jgi:hypothetical protein
LSFVLLNIFCIHVWSQLCPTIFGAQVSSYPSHLQSEYSLFRNPLLLPVFFFYSPPDYFTFLSDLNICLLLSIYMIPGWILVYVDTMQNLPLLVTYPVFPFPCISTYEWQDMIQVCRCMFEALSWCDITSNIHCISAGAEWKCFKNNTSSVAIAHIFILLKCKMWSARGSHQQRELLGALPWQTGGARGTPPAKTHSGKQCLSRAFLEFNRISLGLPASYVTSLSLPGTDLL